MSPSTVGIFAGLLLALITIQGGFDWLVLSLLFAAVGYVVGAHLQGKIDLAALLPGRGRG
ncbi:DUF2273 domain-containing protein [Kineococcus indalonis]|uniref:DUF2273 domain-containing protein n=1 Tax=Kineococcus indalonis TaxID=2696566 RepID=UPI0014130853|nr:DUF2273 domain-containing protein [Kineococcus indalonis]NAZ87474.1 DUF2273 domain-containing protein [Kineococcus indalonis]